MKIGDKVYVTKKGSDLTFEATVVGISPRFFGERRKDKRAVSDTHLIQIDRTQKIVLDLRYDVSPHFKN